MKRGIVMLLVLVVLGSVATATVDIESSTTTEDEMTNEKMMDELSRILNKETLNEKDYARIRALLEKMVNTSISDTAWRAIKEYIDDERGKKKWFLEQSKKEINAPVYISSTNPQNHIPILVQQYPDLFGGTFYEGQNYVQKVYYKSNGLKVVDGIQVYEFEYTVVYSDEDAPWPFDEIYDSIRFANWGREEDIETYYLYVHLNGSPWKFYFYYGDPVNSGIYSRDATYYTVPGVHYADKVYWSSFSKNGDRPYIYVNTWNHALGESDNNADLSNWISSYSTAYGSRVDAERSYVDDCSKSPFC